MNKLTSKLLVAGAIVLAFNLSVNKSAEAVTLPIIESPQQVGSYSYNVFHTAIDGSGSGLILAWFDLDTAETNTYNPDTGSLTAHFKIYEESALSTLIGTVTATGSLPGDNFNHPHTNLLAGTLTYSFQFNTDNILRNYLDGTYDVTISYYDTAYTSTLGQDVNDWQVPFLTLWGSGVIDNGSNLLKYLGTDLTLKTGKGEQERVIPEPASLALLASGLMGGFGLRRRQKV